MNQNLATYYHERAAEYDKVYQIPEQQADLLKSAELFQNLFANKSVLEIACGTGYWTEQISKTARSILATDINESVMEIARARQYRNNVSFQVADMNTLKTDRKMDSLFAGFIWSHIPIQELDQLLNAIKELVVDNGLIVFIDSKPVEGTTHDKSRITRTDQFGNTFQTRQLANGTTHEVLKNFPDELFLKEKLSPIATNINIMEVEHYWIATGNRRAAATKEG